MEHNVNIGFQEDPKNGFGIVRSRMTGGQLRSWEIPRTQKALETFNAEIGKLDFPGVYILFDKKKVYVGEAKSLYVRLKQHVSEPEDKIREWDRAYIISNGRPAQQSDLNDEVVRKTLEHYLINLFKANKYTVVAQGEHQKHNPLQQVLSDLFINELNVFLQKKGVIQKLIEEGGQEEVFGDDLKALLLKKKMTINKWQAKDAVVNGEHVFIRQGSQKPKGWQITFRDKFKYALQSGSGRLLIARDEAPFVPLRKIRKVVSDESAYEQNTIDMYVRFAEGRISLSYKDETFDITEYRLKD